MTSDVLPAEGSVSVSVAAPPSVLWRLISDPTVPARFSSELQAARFAEGDRPSVGAVIEGTNGRGATVWTTSSTVLECVEPTTFRWATGPASAPAATWGFEVVATDGGATLTHSVVLHPGVPPLGPAVEAAPERAQEIVDGRMASLLESMEAVATGIAGLAEQAAG